MKEKYFFEMLNNKFSTIVMLHLYILIDSIFDMFSEYFVYAFLGGKIYIMSKVQFYTYICHQQTNL